MRFPPRNGGLPMMKSTCGHSGSLGARASWPCSTGGTPVPLSRIASMQRKLPVMGEGFGGGAEAVEADPLEPADPDGHLGEVEGIGVDLDAVELPGADGGEVGTDAFFHAEEDDFFFEIFEFEERDVEEVAGAAGGVENLDGLEAGEELVALFYGKPQNC